MRKVHTIAEQFTLEGATEWFVYFDDGAIQVFQDYPTEEQLTGSAGRGKLT